MTVDFAQPAPILNESLPDVMRQAAAAPLPRMQPLEGSWLRFDDAYGAQMALRRSLVADHRALVIGAEESGMEAARDCLSVVLDDLPDERFIRSGDQVRCPDGVTVQVWPDDPLGTLGAILQQDICLLEKRGDEHVLTAAVLCFPASWTLAEKLGRPMMRIHDPVDRYDDGVGRRVQRFLDALHPDRPLWRANLHRYERADLFHPRREADPRPPAGPNAPYLRSEHQILKRLPHSGAVVFAIHTLVVRAEGA